MISIIVSTYRQFYYDALVRSIQHTIGEIPYELIPVKNQGALSMGEAYNQGAAQAHYPLLCFVHEDVVFETTGWGILLVKMFEENPRLGAVGVAGGFKTFLPTGHGSGMKEWDCICINYMIDGKKSLIRSLRATREPNVLDGVLIVTPQKVWEEYPFAPDVQGFHFYDVDYTYRVSLHYQIKVLDNLLIVHYSHGNFGDEWIKACIRYHKLRKGWFPHEPITKTEITQIRQAYYGLLQPNMAQAKILQKIRYVLALGVDRQSCLPAARFICPKYIKNLFKGNTAAKTQKQLACIAIPVYKPEPDAMELVSLKQAVSVLSAYDFILVCPETMNTQYYETFFLNASVKYSIQRFDDFFFKDIQRYSWLLLAPEFYKRFREYQYLLIYQLDAYVFKDELQYWCALGYDYIGAPLAETYRFQPEKGLEQFKYVGNGGLSLRRVQAFIDRTTSIYPIKSFSQLKKEYLPPAKWKRRFRIFLILCKALGYKNTMRHYKYQIELNEDLFWCVYLKNTRIALSVPDVLTASRFSLEMGAELFYQHNQSLPFGCHAWQKYDYDTLWKNHISILDTNE